MWEEIQAKISWLCGPAPQIFHPSCGTQCGRQIYLKKKSVGETLIPNPTRRIPNSKTQLML